MKKRLVCTTVAWLASLWLAVPASARRLIFVANLSDDTVSVIDGDLDREVKIIPVGNAPQSLALRESDPPLVAVANSRARRATLIDPVTLKALPEGPPTGMGPEAVVFSPDGKTLIATSYYDKTVTFTDLASNTLNGPPIEFEGIPRRLMISPDGRDLFVLVHAEEGVVAIVDLATRSVEKTIPVGRFPSDFALLPGGSQLIAASFDDTTVTFIDLASREPVRKLSVETGFGLLVHPTKPLLYSMLSFDGEVLVFDYKAAKAVTNIVVGGSPTFSAITKDGRFLYVATDDANQVVKVDTSTNEPLLRIATGAGPTGVLIFESHETPTYLVLSAVAAGSAVLFVMGVLALRWRRRKTARITL